MSGAYAAGARETLPNAQCSFDHFHIMALAGEALDAVRRGLRNEAPELKGARWSLLGNEWTRSEAQQAQRQELRVQYPKLGARARLAGESPGCAQ